MNAQENSERDSVESTDLFGAWMPIDTAPEDGSEVLLYQPDAGMQVSWYGYDPDNEELGWYRFSPTHWMPLPSLPNDLGDAPLPENADTKGE